MLFGAGALRDRPFYGATSPPDGEAEEALRGDQQAGRHCEDAERGPPSALAAVMLKFLQASGSASYVQILCFLLPCGLFAGTSFVFTFRRTAPLMVLLVVLPLVLVAALMAVLVLTRGHHKEQYLPFNLLLWHLFLLVAVACSWSAAMVAGFQNFAVLAPYYDFGRMPTYMEVDPDRQTGDQMVDAGRILFHPDAWVDPAKAVGFKNSHVYCVAPVTMGSASDPVAGQQGPTGSYDFWAVGVDCCLGGSGKQARFACGEVSNPKAAAGLRALGAGEDRAYWRLAVQEAEALYGIEARHPIYLHWMQDPVAEVNSYHEHARERLVVQNMAFCAIQLFLVCAAWVLSSKGDVISMHA